MAFSSLSGNILESKESVIVKMFFIHTEAGLDCEVCSFWQCGSLGPTGKSKSCFIVGIWKSGHEGQQSNKQKQQFSDFPPSCITPLQVSKPYLLMHPISLICEKCLQLLYRGFVQSVFASEGHFSVSSTCSLWPYPERLSAQQGSDQVMLTYTRYSSCETSHLWSSCLQVEPKCSQPW